MGAIEPGSTEMIGFFLSFLSSRIPPICRWTRPVGEFSPTAANKYSHALPY